MSTNPEVQTLPEWKWVKVATSVTTGKLNRLESSVAYYQTYRVTGDTEPTEPTIGIIPDEAVKIFELDNQEDIGSTDPIDVYIMCANSDNDDNDQGKIRIDL